MLGKNRVENMINPLPSPVTSMSRNCAQLSEHRVNAKATSHVVTVGGFVQPSVLRAYATLHLLDSYDAVATWVRHFGWDSPRAFGDLQPGMRKLSDSVRNFL